MYKLWAPQVMICNLVIKIISFIEILTVQQNEALITILFALFHGLNSSN